MRGEMGKCGMDPSKLAYVLPYDQYYNLMNNAGFTDISEVGSDAVAGGRGINPRVSGVLGYFYGVPVVASEFFSELLAQLIQLQLYLFTLLRSLFHVYVA